MLTQIPDKYRINLQSTMLEKKELINFKNNKQEINFITGNTVTAHLLQK